MSRAFRAVCSLALLAFLAYAVDWQALPGYFAQLNWLPAATAVAGLSAHFIISPWKWQWALRIHDLHFDLRYLVRTNGIGFFLNNFLPSAIGGDAYRVVSTLPDEGFRSRAVSAVLLERIVGFSAMAGFGALGAAVLFVDSAVARTFLAISIACGGVGVIVLWSVYVGWFKPLTNRVRHTKVFETVQHNYGFLRQAGAQWIPLIGISLLFQAVSIANIYFLFQALAVPVSLPVCALIGAVAGLATVIPLSVNGIGVVEGSFAGTAVALGIDYEAALTVAILIRLLVLPPSIYFGLLYAIRGNARSPSAATVVATGDRVI